MALRLSRSIELAMAFAMATSPFIAMAQNTKDSVDAPRLATPTQPATPASPVTGKPAPVSSSAPGSIQDDASKRAAKPSVPQSGPATLKDQTKKTSAAPQPAGSGQITDRNGQPISGATEVGTNQILDPRTGKIHKTVPTANGAQVID